MLSRRWHPSALRTPPEILPIYVPINREANPFLRRVRRLSTYRNLSDRWHLFAKQIIVSVGMVIDHPQYDERFRYRKREIGNKSSVRRYVASAVPYIT